MEELNHLYYSKKSDNGKVRKIQMALEKGSSIQSLYEMEIEMLTQKEAFRRLLSDETIDEIPTFLVGK